MVEDEEHLQKMISLNLELEGYEIEVASNGSVAEKLFNEKKYDLIILDVMLPIRSGYEVCSYIREKDKVVPIMFLTAKGLGEDRVKGLKIGADDYLVKPFHLEELLLRVKNLLSRSLPIEPDVAVIKFGENKVNLRTYEAVTFDGKMLKLSKRELALLRLLNSKSGEVVSRDEILETAWGYDSFPSTRTIDNYILGFRKYFEADPRSPKYFHSVRGVGYRFTPLA